MNGTNYDATGGNSLYDALKIRKTDTGIQLIPVKFKPIIPENNNTDVVEVSLFSDFMCPWCLLAVTMLDGLRSMYPIRIHHIGMELYPDTEEQGMPIPAHSCSDSAIRRINYKGQAYGLKIPEMKFRPNTHKALILSEYAASVGKQDAFVRAVWDAYLLKQENIGELSVLCRVADHVGISEKEVLSALQNPLFEEQLSTNMSKAAKYQIKSAPSFIINDRYLVRGMEDASLFENIFSRV